MTTELNQEHNLHDWLFLEYFNKLRMNGCTKVVVHLKTDNGEERIMSSTEVGNENEFISSFCSY